MTRRCSHCSHNGHNSRTCPNKGVKLFGVRLTEGLIRKSASMGNLSHYSASGSGLNLAAGSSGGSGVNCPGSPGDMTPDHAGDGYASEDGVPGSASRERKRGVPWTEEEHRMFLLGLQKLGKGDWRGISRSYVVTRTPTQVASHAQKYFIRQSNVSRRKRRSSLFDMVAEESGDTPMLSRDFISVDEQPAEMQAIDPSPVPVPPEVVDEECESMESTNSNDGDPAPPQPENPEPQPSYPVIYPAYFSPFYPFPLPTLWTGTGSGFETAGEEKHEVLKPTAVYTKSPINVDVVGMSKLTLGGATSDAGPSSLSLKLLEGSRRQSAFHPNPALGTSSMGSTSGSVEAVQQC